MQMTWSMVGTAGKAEDMENRNGEEGPRRVHSTKYS